MTFSMKPLQGFSEKNNSSCAFRSERKKIEDTVEHSVFSDARSCFVAALLRTANSRSMK